MKMLVYERYICTPYLVLRLGVERVHVVLQVMVRRLVAAMALLFEAGHAMTGLVVVNQRLQVVLYLCLVERRGDIAAIRTHFYLLLLSCKLFLGQFLPLMDRCLQDSRYKEVRRVTL